MISYEFPLTERTRTLMRLEALHAKNLHFTAQETPADHNAALCTLFEILEIFSRADLKSDLLQELDRQQKQLSTLHNNPEISESALTAVLGEIEHAYSSILNSQGKLGQHLRENEWLMSIKQRTGIPGGTCEFELPSYGHWLSQDVTLRRNYLTDHLAPFLPMLNGISTTLKLLREKGSTTHSVAHQGVFQHTQSGHAGQMLRVTLSKILPCVPEVSANKYVLNVRFIATNYVSKLALYNQDVEFDITRCSL